MTTPQSTPPANPLDAFSALLKAVTDAIIGRYPRTTAISLCLAIVLPWLADIFKGPLQTIGINSADISPIPLAALFLTIGLSIVTIRKPKFSPSIEEALTLIRVAKKEAKLPNTQVKLMYIALVNKVIEKVELTQEAKKQLEEVGKK